MPHDVSTLMTAFSFVSSFKIDDAGVHRRQRRMSERWNWTDELERMRSSATLPAFLGMDCVDEARYQYVYLVKSSHFDNSMGGIVPLLAN